MYSSGLNRDSFKIGWGFNTELSKSTNYNLKKSTTTIVHVFRIVPQLEAASTFFLVASSSNCPGCSGLSCSGSAKMRSSSSMAAASAVPEPAAASWSRRFLRRRASLRRAETGRAREGINVATGAVVVVVVVVVVAVKADVDCSRDFCSLVQQYGMS